MSNAVLIYKRVALSKMHKIIENTILIQEQGVLR